MFFNAGRWGMVEVDEIDERPDEKPPRIIGIKYQDNGHIKTSYHNFGEKLGCTVVETIPPAVRSPEIYAKNRAQLVRVCNAIFQRANMEL